MDDRTDEEIIDEVTSKTISFVCHTLGSSLGLPKDATMFDLFCHFYLLGDRDE